MLDAAHITFETLQNLRNDDACQCQGLCLGIIRRNSTPARVGEELRKSIHTELSSSIKGHQDQTRFFRMDLGSPFQMPLP
jgi:hypothetical protein